MPFLSLFALLFTLSPSLFFSIVVVAVDPRTCLPRRSWCPRRRRPGLAATVVVAGGGGGGSSCSASSPPPSSSPSPHALREACACLCASILEGKPPAPLVIGDADLGIPFAARGYGFAGGGGGGRDRKEAAGKTTTTTNDDRPLRLRFFAGAPLIPCGALLPSSALGVLAVASPCPRASQLTPAAAAALRSAADAAAALLSSRAAAAAAESALLGLPRAADAAASPAALVDAGEPGWRLLGANAAWFQITSSSPSAASLCGGGGGSAGGAMMLWDLLRVVGATTAAAAAARNSSGSSSAWPSSNSINFAMEDRELALAASRTRGGPAAVGEALALGVARGRPFAVRVALRRSPSSSSSGNSNGGNLAATSTLDALILPRRPPNSADGNNSSSSSTTIVRSPRGFRLGPGACTVLLLPPAAATTATTTAAAAAPKHRDQNNNPVFARLLDALPSRYN